MTARSVAATLAGAAALLVARPGAAHRDRLGDDARAIKRDVLILVSTGLGELGMWKEAAAVSRHLAATADDSVDACVAQAAVVWQTTESSPAGKKAFAEWERLRLLANRVEVDQSATVADKALCRASYRRVTGNLVYRSQMTFHCGPWSVWIAPLERLRIVAAAYELGPL